MFFSKETKSVTLCCFSPPVVLATFLIELALAIYAWWRYRSTHFGRLATVFLLLLAGFQGSELLICFGHSAIIWSKIGFICTTFMPILGIDLIYELRRKRASLAWGYALASALAVVIAIFPGIFQDAACTGTFVAFQTRSLTFDFVYVLYYLTTLFLGIFLILESSKEKGANKAALRWLLIGYASDMIPTFVVYGLTFVGQTAIASVLCGFAVILALIIGFKVLPLALHQNGK